MARLRDHTKLLPRAVARWTFDAARPVDLRVKLDADDDVRVYVLPEIDAILSGGRYKELEKASKFHDYVYALTDRVRLPRGRWSVVVANPTENDVDLDMELMTRSVFPR